jgi:putative ATP-binding cassette transporter
LTQELLKPVIEKEFTHKTEMYEQMSHILNGFKELKISQPQNDDIFHNYLSQAINQTQNTRFSSLASHTHFLLIVNVSFYFVIGLTSFVFTTYFEQNLLIQVMTIYIFMWTPTLSILTAIPYIQNGQIALKQLMSLIKEFGDSDDETIPVNISEHEPINSFKRIYFDKLTYKYQQKAKSTTFCVGPLNLEIHSGEIIFITGGNGCGKTTLLKLITGLYQPLLGNVYIDQKYVNIADHRYLFSAIFSDFYLFDKLYGFDKIDKQQIDHLLATMALNKKVEWVDKHFSTKKLSTGERKRLALIAALLEDRPIYVFDEWAADQDTYFRHYFYETLLPLLKQQGKTVIVVTHDDTFFHLADQHIRLNYGQLENK